MRLTFNMSSKQQKKGKSQQRTVNVSADGGPSLSMTPEAAAKYLQQATTQNTNREVKISFGPSRPPSFEALKETAAREGLPCSEAEMKALMGMFVEIMGMNMEDKKASSSSKKKKNGTLPNWPDQESLAAATAGFFQDGANLEALKRTYGAMYQASAAYADAEDDDDVDDEDDSIPDLDIRDSRTGPMGPGSWESLDGVSMGEVLDAAAKRREKQQRRSLKQKENDVAKAAEVAMKKREKDILSWRGRVVTACQAGEVSKLKTLILESPLDEAEDEGHDVIPHLEFLLPHSIAKNRSQLERGKEARRKLAAFLLDEELHLAFEPMRSGRSVLHTACLVGDVQFVDLVIEKLEQYLREHLKYKDPLFAREDLDMTCSDSGWTPLHYATASGATDVMELLLRAGCNVNARTDSTHTWRTSDGAGLTTRELINCIRKDTIEKDLQTHGVAIQEIQAQYMGTPKDKASFRKIMEYYVKRLRDVEVNGYVVPGLLEQATTFADDDDGLVDNGNQESPAGGRKRKKKKKKKKQAGKQPELKSAEATVTPLPKASVPISTAKEAPPEEFEDPLVTALLGMGFVKEQISAALKACGGTHRATADELVTWILGQDADGGEVGGDDETSRDQAKKVEVTETTVLEKSTLDESTQAEEERRQKEEAARRLAEKREAQRRRNREWNNREQARQQQQAQARIGPGVAVSGPRLPSGIPVRATGPPVVVNAHPSPPQEVPPETSTIKGYTVATSPTTQPVGVAPPNSTIKAETTNFAEKKSASANMTQVAPVKPTAVRSDQTEFPSLSQSMQSSGQTPASRTKPPPIASPPAMTASNSFPPIGDDDRTVSSFGSNRGLSVSSVPYLPPGVAPQQQTASMAPPGFSNQAPSIIPESMTTLSESANEDSHRGEIRATAREFVPKEYTPPPILTDSVFNAPSSLSSDFGPGLGAPLTSALPEMMHGREYSAIPFSRSFLSNTGATPPTSSSFLSGLSHAYDRVPEATPASEDASTATRSIGSSLTGIPGLDDSALRVGLGSFGFSLDHQQQSAGNTASLLSSSFTNAPVGAEALWGGASLPPLNFNTDSRSTANSKDGGDRTAATWAPGGSIW